MPELRNKDYDFITVFLPDSRIWKHPTFASFEQFRLAFLLWL